jgi:hypothetical protein
MFGLITFIQMIGNIFFCYKEIDETGELFKSWMELTGPVWEMLGSKANDVISMKRWLAFLEGGLLPIISLTSLHFFTKYDDGKTGNEKVKEVIKEVIVTSATFMSPAYLNSFELPVAVDCVAIIKFSLI